MITYLEFIMLYTSISITGTSVLMEYAHVMVMN